MMWLGIILGIGVALCVLCAGAVLEGGWSRISRQRLIMLASGGLCGFLVTILAYAVKDPWPSACKYVALALVLLAYLALTIWWVREGGRWREFFVFALIGTLLFFPLKVVTALLGDTVDAVSTLLVSLMTGIWPISLCFFKAQNYGRSEETRTKSTVYRVIAWILVALLVLTGIFGIYRVIKTLTPKEPEIVEQEPEPEPEPIPEPERWYALTAEELIQKSELTAELEAEIVPGEFGPKPVYDYEKVKPEEVWEDLKTVSRVYPIVGISAIYYKDSVTGKRDLSDYYQAYDDDTDALNAAISYYIGLEPGAEANQYDPKPYQDFVSFVFENIEAYEPEYRIYTTKELKKLKMTVKDQLYMEPGFETVVDEYGNEIHIPKVVVWTSEMAEDDHFLYVRHLIKGRVVELWFHIECLFQPCNPSDTMRVTVAKNPNIPTKPTPPTPPKQQTTEDVGGKASTEEIGGKVTTEEVGGKVTFDITHPKDSTRGADVGENDNKGHGGDTNNGVGATVSRADTPTGTGPALMSDEQRHNWTQEQIRINETQRTADNTPENKPTTVVQNVDEIDSNADKGTGNGGINEETKVKPAETINGGQQLQNSTEKTADGAWTPSEDVTKGAKASVFETDGRVDTNFVPEPPAQHAAGGLDFGANG